ncbi:MAG: AzlC family ABC transporter permease [Aquihabitans sp.]
MLPILAGLAPLGLLVGTAAATAGGSLAQGLASSWLVYSGSPQLALAQLTRAGSDLAAVVLTALLLNGRLIAYSASVSARWGAGPRRHRWLAAAVLVDPPYALAMADDDLADRRAWRWRYLGSGLALWVGWQVLVVLGMVVGSHLPLERLAFAVPLVIIAILVPLADDPAARRGALVACVAAVAAQGLPAGTALFVVGPLAVAAAAPGRRGWWAETPAAVPS